MSEKPLFSKEIRLLRVKRFDKVQYFRTIEKGAHKV